MESEGRPTPREAAPLFGRVEVFESAIRALHAASDASEGRLVLVTGSGGVGKTTFLKAVAEAASGLGWEVLHARALPSDPPRPFAIVEDLLRAAQAGQRLRESLPPQEANLPLFAAPIESESLSEPSYGPADEETSEADRLLAHLASPAERVDADRSAFFGRLTGFFRDLARSKPLFLGIDDLPFADDSSFEFLRQLLASLGESRLVVVATRVPEAETPVRASAALERLASAPHTVATELRPMTESELREYVRWLLLGRDPGRDAVMRWFSQTEGNPLFTEYLVRATTGFSPPSAEAASSDLSELLRSRITRLDEGERRALVHAAVLGKEFDFATLDAAAGLEEERLSEQLDRLVHEGILREKGGEVYEFVSERARADVYAQLTETRRRLLHRKVASALLERDGVTSANLYELARQCYLGRDDARAVELNRKAAGLAARAFAFDTAAVHLERALECQRRLVPRDPSAEVRILIELGSACDELGDLRRSEETLLDGVARARAVAGLDEDLALALLGLAQTRSDSGQYVSARDLGTEAFRILERLGHRRGLMAAHRVLGVACWRLGELTAAEEHQRAQVALAESEGSPAELGHALIDLANTYTLGGVQRTEEALELYERAAQLFARVRNPSAEARVLMNRALLHHYAGRHDESLRVMTEALGAAERSRSPIWIGYCSINLAQFHVDVGDLAAATREIQHAAALLEPLGDQLAMQQVTMIRGMIAEAGRSWAEAAELYADALARARHLSLSAETAEMEFRQADLAGRRGDLDAARRLLDAARKDGLETLRPDLARRVSELEHALAAPAAPAQP